MVTPSVGRSINSLRSCPSMLYLLNWEPEPTKKSPLDACSMPRVVASPSKRLKLKSIGAEVPPAVVTCSCPSPKLGASLIKTESSIVGRPKKAPAPTSTGSPLASESMISVEPNRYTDAPSQRPADCEGGYDQRH